MSETEINKGVLIKLNLTGDIEEKCRQALDELGIEMSDYCDTYRECVEDRGYRKLYIFNDDIYRVEYNKIDGEEDIFDAQFNENGDIQFTTKFYNGGCSFNEALDYAVETLTNEGGNNS